VDDFCATRSEDVGLIVHAISFQDFQLMCSWSTNVTDRWTHRRTDDMRSQDRALHYSASRGKKSSKHCRATAKPAACPYPPSFAHSRKGKRQRNGWEPCEGVENSKEGKRKRRWRERKRKIGIWQDVILINNDLFCNNQHSFFTLPRCAGTTFPFQK